MSVRVPLKTQPGQKKAKQTSSPREATLTLPTPSRTPATTPQFLEQKDETQKGAGDTEAKEKGKGEEDEKEASEEKEQDQEPLFHEFVTQDH